MRSTRSLMPASDSTSGQAREACGEAMSGAGSSPAFALSAAGGQPLARAAPERNGPARVPHWPARVARRRTVRVYGNGELIVYFTRTL